LTQSGKSTTPVAIAAMMIREGLMIFAVERNDAKGKGERNLTRVHAMHFA
jgi:hypothetical protein